MKYAVVLIGASGAGKSSIANLLLMDEGYELVHSATTRPKRLDKNIGEYIYLSRKEFSERLLMGDFLEYTEYGDNLYGTLKSELDRIFDIGKIPLLVLDINGAISLREGRLDFKPLIFYIYEELSVIEKRLLDRELQSPTGKGMDAYNRRIKQNKEDYLSLPQLSHIFDAFIKNDIIDKAKDEILSLISFLSSGGEPDRAENTRIADELSKMAKACK